MTAAEPVVPDPHLYDPPPPPNDAPWPIVWECHQRFKDGHRCPQSDGSHDHIWAAWENPDPAVLTVVGPGVPVRCRVCGGRKCDMPRCRLRRHHVGEPHDYF